MVRRVRRRQTTAYLAHALADARGAAGDEGDLAAQVGDLLWPCVRRGKQRGDDAPPRSSSCKG